MKTALLVVTISALLAVGLGSKILPVSSTPSLSVSSIANEKPVPMGVFGDLKNI